MRIAAVILALLGCLFLLLAYVGLLRPQIFRNKKTGVVPGRWKLLGGGHLVALIVFAVAIIIMPARSEVTLEDQAQPDLVDRTIITAAQQEKVSQAPVSKPESAHAEQLTKASPESLAQANKQMNALNKAMKDGVSILQSGELAAISAHSKYISALVKVGESKFGSSIFEPLGRCFAAGIDSRSWWSNQLSSVQNGGVERIPGSIKSAFDSYQVNRADCLLAADPVASAKAEAASDAELREKLGGGRECLTVFDVNPETKEVFALPKPSHCKA
ncbi:hypothetical protein SAMN04490179_4520 [Pseudomonas antarctica]|uniref:Uncharacterized protein n=1 Tax=Pseudomonas antarctica TaxID=219572 RepID=A0A1H0BWA0_9PSED|nr:hypothetical protein [Pseudomonas antarctica]KAF2406683.1 hypothetical protein PSAN_48600 [Pseudomonas antarctica]SDN49948.1 hypothetical protein SAMN04490179_4520 [Pseudomonas antarctica]